jgi:LCP family protein required for cell wall assembly
MARTNRTTGRRARASARHLRWFEWAALFGAGMALSAASGGIAFFFPALRAAAQVTGQTVTIPSPSAVAAAVPSPPPAAGAAFTVLLLGSDDDEKFDPKQVLTQSMILVRVDPAAKQVTMMSIPRDLWVPLSVGYTAKIDAAYANGGAGPAIATVEQNFGVHIDDYVWVGLKGLIKLIDALGGVNVVASNPVLDDYYPQDINSSNPYGYERVAVLPGPQHLDGATALQYVRSRHGDLLGDFGRSQRQQQVLLAIRAKASQMSVTDIPDLAAAFQGELKTSMSIGRIRELLPLAGGISPDSIHQLVLNSPYTEIGQIDQQSVVLPHWALIRPLVAEYFR